MKIKKTLFTTEIEITVDEIADSYNKVHPNTLFFEMIMRFLKKLTR